jgi:hypothetical protein
MPIRLYFAVFTFTLLCGTAIAQQSQPASQAQPLNATVSDFGTSFIFSPAPICAGCLETELGFNEVQGSRLLISAITFAPFATHTDFTILTNLLDGEPSATHFGDRLDFVMRQQILARDGWILTVAPRGTLSIRGDGTDRIGATGAIQYGKGANTEIVNVTVTHAIAGSDSSRWDRLISFDYYRSLGSKGTSFFLGAQYESATTPIAVQSAGIEEGLVIPFHNGQVELATEQLNLNAHFALQVQVRVIVNWGSLIRKK